MAPHKKDNIRGFGLPMTDLECAQFADRRKVNNAHTTAVVVAYGAALVAASLASSVACHDTSSSVLTAMTRCQHFDANVVRVTKPSQDRIMEKRKCVRQ